jgi:hypothetical protein
VVTARPPPLVVSTVTGPGLELLPTRHEAAAATGASTTTASATVTTVERTTALGMCERLVRIPAAVILRLRH